MDIIPSLPNRGNVTKITIDRCRNKEDTGASLNRARYPCPDGYGAYLGTPFIAPAIAWTFPIPLSWRTDQPVWVEQWPLKRESLIQAHELVKEQYKQGHLRLSTSPWNTPIFVIKKKSGKYRLLHDLRAVNRQMHDMGALQLGLPNPAMIPEGWHLLIVDLKDCFFTIALHEDDKQRFAFTLPAINREGPDQRFEWTVLPQGMRNSPTLCQLYVDAALQPLRQQWPETMIYHYMDDILLAQKNPFSPEQKFDLITQLKKKELVMAPEKVQESSPWQYLGWHISNATIRPQKLTIRTDIRTLNDAQKLLGDLQWIRPVVGIPNELLNLLRPLLKGTDPAAAVTLTEEQQRVLQEIASLITTRATHRCLENQPLDLTILCGPQYLMGAITQHKIKTGEKRGLAEPIVLEWIAPLLQPKRTIQEKISTLAELIRTLFAPDLHDQRWSNLTAAIKHRRSENRRGKRELKKLGSDCADDVELWGPAERFFAAALAPNVAVAHAMSNLNKLACWAVKQSNVTTQILSEMSQDMDSLRHAVLQNRAAIDFLLLAQGRGCEDFEGMCCFNLSDHGQSIHEQLKWLKDHTQRITVQYNWFDDLFRKMFGNVSTWILSLIKEGLRILFIIVLVLIAVRVIFGCLTQKLEQLTKKVFLAQNKNGGIVEDWLEGRGHVKIEQLKEAELSAYRTQLM
ncbi:LOW QUALITY PROTEIN: uncharacterized protein LOC135324358 [Dromaius novaehollandiae]|uniref:LOW QUALITY PROTEIN: uncharacterized protein LOC135324358 n=1 Tax=Dromaius novaehollandiae TaxID=8790 RepID=UPI00311DAFEA